MYRCIWGVFLGREEVVTTCEWTVLDYIMGLKLCHKDMLSNHVCRYMTYLSKLFPLLFWWGFTLVPCTRRRGTVLNSMDLPHYWSSLSIDLQVRFAYCYVFIAVRNEKYYFNIVQDFCDFRTLALMLNEQVLQYQLCTWNYSWNDLLLEHHRY